MKHTLISFFISIFLMGINSYAQLPDSLKFAPPKWHYLSTSKQNKLITRFQAISAMIGIRGHEQISDLVDLPDSVYWTIDSGSVVLHNGASWNPFKLFEIKNLNRHIRKSKNPDSTRINVMSYILFSSQYEEKEFSYYMIDSLVIVRNCYDMNDNLLFKFKLTNRPTTKELRYACSKVELLYRKEE